MIDESSISVEGLQCIRTLRLKVKAEAYPWLNAAAVEVNQVWNWANKKRSSRQRAKHNAHLQQLSGPHGTDGSGHVCCKVLGVQRVW